MLTKITINARRLYIRHVKGMKPTIDRINKYKNRGYSIKQSARFQYVINRGKSVEYYNTQPVFHNLYRIKSLPDTLDHVIHAVKR